MAQVVSEMHQAMSRVRARRISSARCSQFQKDERPSCMRIHCAFVCALCACAASLQGCFKYPGTEELVKQIQRILSSEAERQGCNNDMLWDALGDLSFADLTKLSSQALGDPKEALNIAIGNVKPALIKKVEGALNPRERKLIADLHDHTSGRAMLDFMQMVVHDPGSLQSHFIKLLMPPVMSKLYEGGLKSCLELGPCKIPLEETMSALDGVTSFYLTLPPLSKCLAAFALLKACITCAPLLLLLPVACMIVVAVFMCCCMGTGKEAKQVPPLAISKDAKVEKRIIPENVVTQEPEQVPPPTATRDEKVEELSEREQILPQQPEHIDYLLPNTVREPEQSVRHEPEEDVCEE